MFNTRIAPSPTGDMHLGTARTAYFNWLAARASGGKFVLRIDDTDLQRNDESKVDDIFQIMDWLKLDYDEVYRQSHYLERYRWEAELLLANGLAKIIDGGAIALNLKDDFMMHYVPDSWKDNIVGLVPISKEDFDYASNMVIIKSDGFPTYNFASIIDDHHLGINYVIRGVDHIKNTSKQVVICYDRNYNVPDYAHVGLLFKDGKKLSKRDGAASMLAYRDAGIDPEAMLNFLLRLGWGPKVDDKTTKILPREKALELFLNQGSMKASPANIDLQKLDSFDRKYKGRSK